MLVCKGLGIRFYHSCLSGAVTVLAAQVRCRRCTMAFFQVTKSIELCWEHELCLNLKSACLNLTCFSIFMEYCASAVKAVTAVSPRKSRVCCQSLFDLHEMHHDWWQCWGCSRELPRSTLPRSFFSHSTRNCPLALIPIPT